MADMTSIEVKAFVPARDFDLSKRFYQDLGFDIAWSDANLAHVKHGHSSFLLQNFYDATHAANFMMHLLVADADAWWDHVQRQGLAAKYGIKAEPPADRPWGMRDFVLVDPTGVLWRIGQRIPDDADEPAPQSAAPAAVLAEVRLLNDDHTPMEFVVQVLEEIFGMDHETATRIMLEIHHQGVGICGIYPPDIAAAKVAEVLDFARRHRHPLQCVLNEGSSIA